MQTASRPRPIAWGHYAIVRIAQWLGGLVQPARSRPENHNHSQPAGAAEVAKPQPAPPTIENHTRYAALYARRADQEIATARTLLAQQQLRAAGAIAGVALEFHLHHVAAAHAIGVGQNATITQLQSALRFVGVLDPHQRKVIQRLSDIRNRCVHAREAVPDAAMVTKLVEGTALLMETLR